jgi:TolA-binding protein
MACMSTRFGILLAVCLVGVAGGCRSTPTIPADAGSAAFSQNPQEGWIYQKLADQHPDVPVADDARPARDIPDDLDLADKKSSSWFDFSALSPTNLKKSWKKMIGKGPNEGVARALYEEGVALFEQKKYKEAAAKFSESADRWPSSPLEEDSLFMLGESNFFADRYPKASDAYQRLLKDYQYTQHMDVAVRRLFAIGHFWEQAARAEPYSSAINFTDKSRPFFDTFGYSIKAYDGVRLNDPTGPLADDATMAEANAYFVRDRFEEAAYHYDLVRKQFPRSEHQINAHVLGMKSKMNMYQGPEYDGAVLEDADEIAKQALTQFGRELGNEKGWIVDTRNQIYEERARRDWAIGQYYERKRYYGSARYYYQAVMKDYPRTETARAAEKRLDEIKSYPDKPPQHFAWLTGMFEPPKRR